MNSGGLYRKFHVRKVDGSPVDPEAEYFVLRVDTDPHARMALIAYSGSVRGENPELARDLLDLVEKYERK